MTEDEAKKIAADSKVAFQAGDYAEAARLLGVVRTFNADVEQAPDGSVMAGAEELSA